MRLWHTQLRAIITSEVEEHGDVVAAEAAQALGCCGGDRPAVSSCCGDTTADTLSPAERDDILRRAVEALSGRVSSVSVTARRAG